MTKATNQSATTSTAQPVTIKRKGLGDAFGMLMETTSNTLSMVNNLAIAGENVTGVLADKSINFREQQVIADTMKHNTLMAALQKQANDLGIDLD